MAAADCNSWPFQSPFELLVVIVGVLGLIQDSQSSALPHAWAGLHALFGGLLLAAVAARFIRRLRRSPRMLPGEIRAFCRHLSRLLYLLLYVLLFVDLLLALARGATRGAAPFAPPANFQGYLAYGLLALVVIRAMGAICRRFAVAGAMGNGRLT
jgi:cytochrome b561